METDTDTERCANDVTTGAFAHREAFAHRQYAGPSRTAFMRSSSVASA